MPESTAQAIVGYGNPVTKSIGELSWAKIATEFTLSLKSWPIL